MVNTLRRFDMESRGLAKLADGGGGEFLPSASSLSPSRSGLPCITAMFNFSLWAKPVARLAWLGLRATITALRQSAIWNLLKINKNFSSTLKSVSCET